jgi:RNA 3'-terminal phosphate cyclase (ATP)
MLTADPGTAGSTTLLLQVALPCLLFSPSGNRASESRTSHEVPPSVLALHGGTNASLAPQIDYTQAVLFPFLSKHFGISPTLTVDRRGYYPRGGGSVLCTVPSISGPLPPVVLTERGQVNTIRGSARVGGLPLWIAQRMVSGARRALLENGIASTKISVTSTRERDEDVVGAGGGILLWAETDDGCLIGGSAVSTREKKPEMVGEEAARELVRNLSHGGCVDEYLQDQIIVFLALAKGTSIVKAGPITDHTRYFDSHHALQRWLRRATELQSI